MIRFIGLATLFLAGVQGSTFTDGTMGSPSWVSHVDSTMLDKYEDLALERHKKAIETALRNYNTDGDLGLSPEDVLKEDEIVNSRLFDKFRVGAHGKLPDFHDQLGDQPIFVTRRETPLFSRDECQEVIDMAEEHVGDGHPWPKLPSGQFYIQGFWIKDVPAVRKWFVEKCKHRLFPLLKRQFPDFVDSVEDLVVDQAYLFKYLPQPGLRTEIHTDAGCLAFTFALNPREEYEGGGTWVEGLLPDEQNSDTYTDSLIEMDAGQCTVRPGGVRHCGNPLTEGTRYIIGGFCMSKSRVEKVRQLMNNCEVKDGPQTTKEALECAIKLNPEFDGPYPNLANCYEKKGDLSKARLILEDCLKFANPKSTNAAYYLGTASYREGNYDKAGEYMKLCLSVHKCDGDAMGTLAQVYAQKGQDENEHEMYKRIIVTPGVSKRILSNAYCNLGAMEAGSHAEMDYYRKSLELEPDNAAALESLGSAHASQKDWDEAIKCYRKAVDLSQGTNTHETIVLLYRSATLKLREEGAAGQMSREQIMARLNELVGAANMAHLMAKQRK